MCGFDNLLKLYVDNFWSINLQETASNLSALALLTTHAIIVLIKTFHLKDCFSSLKNTEAFRGRT